MSNFRSKEEVHKRCMSDRYLVYLEQVDFGKIMTNIEITKGDTEVAEQAIFSKNWNTGLKLYYDILRTLAATYLLFEKVRSINHQCLFAYLCVKHPELDLDWSFFERFRTKRNGIHYYGNPIYEKDWKGIQVQALLYIKTLSAAIENKLDLP
ncbi:hypothetical protein JW968_07030 [Candidatus Woesearchaeota archaeon]|nr:hypothetical protein [Candidatus Woesearchaeota archaeon]